MNRRRISEVRIFLVLIATLLYPSVARTQTLTLDDFEGSSIRVGQPGENNPSYRYLWNLYTPGGTTSVTTENKHDGNQSLKNVYTGATNWQFQLYTYTVGVQGFVDGWQFAKSFILAGTWKNNTHNRLRFWIKVPPGTTPETGGNHNFEFGTYIRCSTCDISSAESENMHFYHFFNFDYTGQWEQAIVDMHPNHQRGGNGNTEWGNQLHPSRESGFNYFDLLTRFYMDFPYLKFASPSTFYIDSFEFYNQTAQENEDQVYSVHGTYIAASNTLKIGWQRNKNENTILHEVRYAFSDIHTLGWNSATVAPNGIIAPPGDGGYNGMEYQTNAINLSAQSVIYLAIKPQNSNLFRQIAIPVSSFAASSPPQAPSNLIVW